MPKQKDLKRLVRSRMKKTGESYTTARTHVTRKSAPAKKPTDYAALAGMSDSAIQAKTGKTWAQWVRALDAIDATKLPHREIAEHVHTVFGVPGWWTQAVTVGYERIKGLREIGQRRSGAYETSKSKTLPVPAKVAFEAFANARTRKKWLADIALTVRKATPSKSVRITWPDGTDVQVWITAKGEKCSVAVQHTKLASKEDVNARKAFWAERLAGLADLLSD
ncbi:MAG TPA: hypothetical protein VEC56_11480 [Candidatus Krumholzibacteria bacterium]|nr:hypothetical protein [Candidatus Krumholzibacteria bacterium]